MKKILAIILIFGILLCGCNRKVPEVQPPTQPPISETTQPAQTPTQPESDSADESLCLQHPMCAVALPITTELTHNDESTFTYQDIHLYCQDQEVADRVIIDYLNRQDTHRKTAESSGNLQYDVLYRPMRLDSGILSLYGESVLHKGQNHPIVECLSANYNMISGETLTLGSILKDNSSLEKLQDALLFAAESAAEEKQLYSEYPQIIAERFTKNPSYDESWYFSTTGLCFYYEPYEIAPYISGVVSLEIPYNRLVTIIDDSFFPAEEDLSEGNIVAASIENFNLNSYSQIVEVRLNGYSDAAVLYCDGLARDVRIEILSADNTISGGTIFASSTLSPGDGIMLMYDQTDDMPILQITYRSGQNLVSKRLYFADDGSLVLA